MLRSYAPVGAADEMSEAGQDACRITLYLVEYFLIHTTYLVQEGTTVLSNNFS